MAEDAATEGDECPKPRKADDVVLSVTGLSVEVDGRPILKEIDLALEKGQTHVLFGPNGSGKTSLLLTIAGFPGYRITSGEIRFEGRNINGAGVDERARRGIGLGFQLPREIRGVKLSDMLRICASKKPGEPFSAEENELITKFRLEALLEREVNHKFSGGEMKRAEILQLLLMKPKLLLLDEPDSGVDVESLKLIGREIRGYVDEQDACALIITHQGSILEELNAERGYVLVDSRIHCHKRPLRILETIRTRGYKACTRCFEGHKLR